MKRPHQGNGVWSTGVPQSLDLVGLSEQGMVTFRAGRNTAGFLYMNILSAAFTGQGACAGHLSGFKLNAPL